MIVRILNDNSVVIVDGIKPEDEDKFIELNTSGNFKKIDNLPESRYGFYKYDPDNDVIVVDEEKEIKKYKEELISRYNELTKEYILRYYPIEKQQADEQQKDYYGTALLMIRNNDTDPATPDLTVDIIYMTVGHHASEILNGEKTLSEIVSLYPETEQFYWEQLIKGAIRKIWVIKCVQVFNEKRNQVLNASSIEELETLDTQFLEFPEFPF